MSTSRYPDSALGKIIATYFPAVTKVPFIFKQREITPQPLIITPAMARESICHCCGGCCIRFTLDWLPTEPHPPTVEEREVEFNNKKYTILTDFQKDNTRPVCKYLSEDSKCTIHTMNPFSCDFELIRRTGGGLKVKKYGRPFYMVQYSARTLDYKEYKPSQQLCKPIHKRVYDEDHLLPFTKPEYQPLCDITTPTKKGAQESIRKLERLKQWTDYFELNETWIPEVISYLELGSWRHGTAIYGTNDDVEGILF